MNTEEARDILAKELESYQAKSYSELAQSIGETIVLENKGMSNASYQIEITILWDNQSDKAIRVMASIDDGGWRSFFPLTDSILKHPSE